ncbi:hypothetical protein BHYA_0324g00070 [Botrytis hyacinthi]|uniref:Uncharacterized protein n=1 Tax=Botrytis hyacinthi TaxID=278943 RepID=A0A4Z1GA89_9HELO|nr:hypothetical protein BHYA_0324g00070 [Botrytis hyacinthi]
MNHVLAQTNRGSWLIKIDSMSKKYLRPATEEKNDPSTSSGSGRRDHKPPSHRQSRDSGHRSRHHQQSGHTSAPSAHLSSGVGQGERSSSSVQSSSSQSSGTRHPQGYGRGALAQVMTSMTLSQTEIIQPPFPETCDYRVPNHPCPNRWTKHWQQQWKFRCDSHPADKFSQKGMFCHKVKFPEEKDAYGTIIQSEQLCGDPIITKEMFLNENFICRECEPPVKTLVCTFWIISEGRICGLEKEVEGDRDYYKDPRYRCTRHAGLTPEMIQHVHNHAQKRMINGRQPFADVQSFEQLLAEGGILDDRLPSARGGENFPRDMGQGRIAPRARKHIGRGGMPVANRYDYWEPTNRAGTPQPGGYGPIEPEPASAPSGYGYSESTSSEPSYQQQAYDQTAYQQQTYQELPYSESPQTFSDQSVTSYEAQEPQIVTAPLRGEVEYDMRADESHETRTRRVRMEEREAEERMRTASQGFAALDNLYEQKAKKRRKHR